MKISNIVIIALLSLFLLSGCAKTKLDNSWSDPMNKTSYKHIMVIGITPNKLNRRAYESGFVADLRESGIEAQTSFSLISQQDQLDFGNVEKGTFRRVVEKAIKDSNVDAVLITHVAYVEGTEVYQPSMDYQPDYAASGYYGGMPGYGYGGMYGYGGYVTTYVQQPGTYVEEKDYTLDSRLFDAKTEEVVWTARSKSYSPDSIEQTIHDITKLLIENLKSRQLIK